MVLEKYDQYKRRPFEGIDELMDWYNYDKPHMSLDFKNAETSEEAFWRKLPEEMIFK